MKAMNGGAWAAELGTKWARHWQATDRTFDGLTERMIELAAGESFTCAYDVGCGAGQTAIMLAQLNANAPVLGVDISRALIDVARKRAQEWPNLSFDCADVAEWLPRDGLRPDLLFARHTVMFFDDPVRDFAHLRHLAAEDSRLIFTCFREGAQNSWIRDITALLPQDDHSRPSAGQPGPLAFHDQAAVTRVLEQSGWGDVMFEPVDYDMVIGQGADAVKEAAEYLLEIGPASIAVRGFSEEGKVDFIRRLEAMLQTREKDGKVSLDGAVWLVSARAS